MRKIVLFVFLLGALCANAVDVTSYYKPAQYQEARYQEAQYEASYNAARYNEAVSDMSWSNSMLGRKITITNDKGVTNRDFGTVGAPAPAFKTASGQTPHVYGGGGIGGSELSGGSRTQNNATFSQNVNSAVVPMAIPEIQGADDPSTAFDVVCPNCGEPLGTITINRDWVLFRGYVYKIDSKINGFWEYLGAIFGIGNYYDEYDDAVRAVEQMKTKIIERHHCKTPQPSPLGSSLIPLLLMLLCYALFRLVRGEVREEQEMA